MELGLGVSYRGQDLGPRLRFSSRLGLSVGPRGQVQFQGSAPGSGSDSVGGSKVMFPRSRVRGCSSCFRLGVSSRSGVSSGFKGRVSSQVRVSSRDGELSIRTLGWGLGLGLRVSSSHGLSTGAQVQVQGSVSGQGVGLDLKSGSWA